MTSFDWELQRMLELILAVRRQRGEDITLSDLVSQYSQQKHFHDQQREEASSAEPLASMVFQKEVFQK
ncbi:MAG: hypothetical protein ACRBCI_01395 [Cellvibrionaceae bacterium]